MARLQQYPGSGKHEGKIFYRIQPYLADGKRITFRFGTGKKNAETGAKAIGDLIDSHWAGVEPTALTKAWIADKADQNICLKLLEQGLIDALPPRFCDQQQSETKLSALAEEFIRVRGAGQTASTVTLYRKAKDNLIDCFGDVGIENLCKRQGREFWR